MFTYLTLGQDHMNILVAIVTNLFLFSLATFLYCHDEKILNGDFIYDDNGTIVLNPLVLGAVPFDKIWTLDFWGHDELKDQESHKSWRYVVA